VVLRSSTIQGGGNVNLTSTAGDKGPGRNGVTQGMVEIRNPATGKWVAKKAETTFFPKDWTRRRVEMEIESAFANSTTKYRSGQPYWQGTSSSGVKVEGYYKRPGGGAATAYPLIMIYELSSEGEGGYGE